MGGLLNFEFFSAGYTTGIGFHEGSILLSGINWNIIRTNSFI